MQGARGQGKLAPMSFGSLEKTHQKGNQLSDQFKTIRGMSDLLPEITPVWQHVEALWRSCMQRFGYHEIRMPLVERCDLFKRAIGDVTDIVEKEMYVFDDRNGDRLALRPEGTAQCVRAVLDAHLIRGDQPRLWYQGPMFRHERPQKGRYRQFHQLGIEAFGFPDAGIEIEQLSLCRVFFEALGLPETRLEVNSLGNSTTREAYREALQAYFAPHLHRLTPEEQDRLARNPLRVLDSKNPELHDLIAQAPALVDHLNAEEREDFEALQQGLKAIGLPFTVNPRLVRGLDYYSGTVFEWVSDRLGAQSTVCAGGRYDGLVAMLGGPPTPAFGLSLGMERLILLLSCNMPPCVDACLITPGLQEAQVALVAERLRRAHPTLRLQVVLSRGTMKQQMRQADKSGAHFALIVGDREWDQGLVTLKPLRDPTQPQISVKEDDLRMDEHLNIS